MIRIILPAVFFLGAIVIGIFFLAPSWDKFQFTRAEIENLETISAEIDTLSARRNELAEKINSIPKENLDRLEQIIPQGAQGPEFLVYLDQLAVRNELVVKRLDLSAPLKSKPKPGSTAQISYPSANQEGAPQNTQFIQPSAINELSVNISVTGQYDAFRKFLKDLENYIRITDVKNILLMPSDINDYSVGLRLSTHFQQ